VNSIEALSRSTVPFMPKTLVTGGGGTVEGVLALMMGQMEAGLNGRTLPKQ